MGEIWEIKLTEGGVRWLWMLEFLGGLWCWCGDARFGIPEMEAIPFRRDVREGENNGYLPPLRHPQWVVVDCQLQWLSEMGARFFTLRRGLENVERDVKCILNFVLWLGVPRHRGGIPGAISPFRQISWLPKVGEGRLINLRDKCIFTWATSTHNILE
jgi:hypothetical protein